MSNIRARLKKLEQASELRDDIVVLWIVADGQTYTEEQHQIALATGKGEAARTGSRLVYADLTVFKYAD